MKPPTVKSKPQIRNSKLIEQYQRAQIETASPTRLVVLLYDGAIRFCSQAIEAMEARDREAQNHYLLKAQRILGELMSSLDQKVGGEIAANLLRLYTYLYEQLVLANLKDRPAPIRQAVTMLQELRETWSEIDRQATQSAPSPAPGAEGDLLRSQSPRAATPTPRLGGQRA